VKQRDRGSRSALGLAPCFTGGSTLRQGRRKFDRCGAARAKGWHGHGALGRSSFTGVRRRIGRLEFSFLTTSRGGLKSR